MEEKRVGLGHRNRGRAPKPMPRAVRLHRDMADALEDFRRSTAVRCLRLMRELDLLTDEEMARFSDDVQRVLRL